jgi:D-alanyl-D-alanine carboxypeptidase/D-alanyl-D-alanine-endopeptidase (penicillin-binding protein 4)
LSKKGFRFLLVAFLLWRGRRAGGEDHFVDPLTNLEKEVAKLVSSHSLEKARVGIHVVRLSDGKAILSRNANETLMVASNNKLFVTAAALELLGQDFRFETLVWTAARLDDDGTLHGNVVVRGGGDPNLSGRFHERPTSIFEGWAKEFRKKGIVRIQGDIIADDQAFDREWVNPHWPEDQFIFWYCAPSSALSFNDNCLDVTIAPGKTVNSPLIVTTSPTTTYAQIQVTAVTGRAKSGSAVWFRREPGTNNVTVGGKHPLGGSSCTEYVTVHDPALFAVHVFREVLVAQGVEVTGAAKVWRAQPLDPKKGGCRIALYSSPLFETLCVTNKRSQNFYAEQILKTLGLFTKGKGTTANGLAAVAGFLEKAGIAPGSYQMVDGCGLARENRFSAAQAAQLLAWMYRSKHRDMFRNSLALAGEDGTLSKRFDDSDLKGRVHAKTGYISGASALSGYISSKTGGEYAFSVLVNNAKAPLHKIRDFQEAVCEAVSRLPVPKP